MARLTIQRSKIVRVNRRNKFTVNYAGMDSKKEDHTDMDYFNEEEDDADDEVIQLQPTKQVKQVKKYRKVLKFLLRRTTRYLRRSPRYFKQL